MRRFKLKELLSVFVFLMVVQLTIGIADIFLAKAGSDLSSITAILISICSLPISLIDSKLPFFVSENLVMVGLYWVINVIIQAVFAYLLLIVVRKMKENK